mgnify:CR=1 FL=1
MKPAKRLAHRVIEGQAFVLEPREKMIHSLNPAASFIWERLCKGRAEEEIAAELCGEFEVAPAAARADVAEFLAELRAKRLLENA